MLHLFVSVLRCGFFSFLLAECVRPLCEVKGFVTVVVVVALGERGRRVLKGKDGGKACNVWRNVARGMSLACGADVVEREIV